MAIAPGQLHRELAHLVGAEHVLEGAAASAAAYNEDQSHRRGLVGRADAVVLPGSAQEVAAVLGWCYSHDVPLVARGGGTGLVGGAVPTEGGVVCSLERLRSVRELEPGLWEMHVDAGVSTRHVQRLARENGLLFAPDPGAAEQSQIGGNVATNAGGPHALKYGVTGSWVTGLEAALAPGELVSLGGRARKDVAGYDLKSLLVGSEGTLGVITGVRLRLLPAPEAARSLVAFFQTRAQGCAAILEVLGAGIQASALDFLDGVTLELVGGGYPGVLPDGAGSGDSASGDSGFALIIRARRSSSCSRPSRSPSRSRATRPRCGAGATASTVWCERRAAARCQRTSRSPSSGCRRGSSASRRWPPSAGCARARGGTAARATCMRRCSSTPPARPSSTRRMPQARSCSRSWPRLAARSPPSTASAGSSAAASQRSGTRARWRCTKR